MKDVFVDSGGFFALLAAEDAFHVAVSELFEQANREAWNLVTTNAVVYESYALLLNRSRDGRGSALKLLDLIAADAYCTAQGDHGAGTAHELRSHAALHASRSGCTARRDCTVELQAPAARAGTGGVGSRQ